MNVVENEAINIVAEGNVLSLEYRRDVLVGTIRTTGSFGVLHRFRSSSVFSEEPLREAYRTNKTISFNATVGEDDALHLYSRVRLLAETCTKTVTRPFGNPEPYKEVACGQSLPCKFHEYVLECGTEPSGLRRHKNACRTYGGPQTCTLGMAIKYK